MDTQLFTEVLPTNRTRDVCNVDEVNMQRNISGTGKRQPTRVKPEEMISYIIRELKAGRGDVGVSEVKQETAQDGLEETKTVIMKSEPLNTKEPHESSKDTVPTGSALNHKIKEPPDSVCSQFVDFKEERSNNIRPEADDSNVKQGQEIETLVIIKNEPTYVEELPQEPSNGGKYQSDAFKKEINMDVEEQCLDEVTIPLLKCDTVLEEDPTSVDLQEGGITVSKDMDGNHSSESATMDQICEAPCVNGDRPVLLEWDFGTILESQTRQVTNKKPKKKRDKSNAKMYECDTCEYRTHDKAYIGSHMTTHTGERKFVCDICDFRCNRMYILKTHKVIHSNETPFACDQCDFKGKTSGRLYNHKKTHTDEKPYVCSICEHRTKTSSRLKAHIKNLHSQEKPYKCDMCEYRGKNRGTLKIHMNTHTGLRPRPFVCEICDYSCHNRTTLRVHMRTHTGEKPHCCDFCDFRSSQSSTLYKHMLKHQDQRPFSCHHCGSAFKRKSHLIHHVNIHNDNRPFACEDCDYKGKVKYNLQAHIKQRHMSKVKAFICDECGFRTTGLARLKSHEETHSLNKPFNCEICDYKCRTKDFLRTHMMTHTGEKPYSCDSCEFRCARKYILKVHKMTHTDERPFPCDLCDNKCRTLAALRMHKKTHLCDQRPFPCEYCEYKGKTPSCIKFHMATHTREKPFSCDKCDSKFSRNYILKQHTMRFHTGERRFKCNMCEYEAFVLIDLNHHLVRAHSLKPYACGKCDFRVETHSQLKAHQKTHAGKS